MHSRALLTAAACVIAAAAAAAPASNQPNIVFVLVDDLDAHMTNLEEVMPSLQKHFVQGGTMFPKHYTSVSLCCPARVSLLTGQAAHNHNVTDVESPHGGYQKFEEGGFNEDYLPIWLQEGGYNTFYVGKILNELTIQNWQSPPLKGWTGTDLLLDPFAYDFLRPAFGRNDEPWFRYNNSYTTDLVAEKSLGFLDDALKSDKPFFLGVAPVAPHSEVLVDIEAQTVAQFKPRPAARHEGRFAGAQVPRGANFNPDEPSGAGWIKELDKLTETEVVFGDDWHAGRLESLLAVDEMIDALFNKLEKANVLDNTYVIFTSDNGFHISQHRLFPGKTCGFEEDINIPFYIRGPGVAKGAISDVVTGHIDVAPTILNMAGIPLREQFDGRPIPLSRESISDGDKPKVEHVNVEMYRDTNAHSFMNGTADRQTVNFTYTSVRLLSDDYNMYYSVWCTGEHELYDLNTDPQQMINLFERGFDGTEDRDFVRLAERLDALTYVLKSCRADSCRFPWEALMPEDDVHTLSDAMRPKFDDFFANEVPRIVYSSCEAGHVVEAEGAQFETWEERVNAVKREFQEGQYLTRELARKYLFLA